MTYSTILKCSQAIKNNLFTEGKDYLAIGSSPSAQLAVLDDSGVRRNMYLESLRYLIRLNPTEYAYFEVVSNET